MPPGGQDSHPHCPPSSIHTPQTPPCETASKKISSTNSSPSPPLALEREKGWDNNSRGRKRGKREKQVKTEERRREVVTDRREDQKRSGDAARVRAAAAGAQPRKQQQQPLPLPLPLTLSACAGGSVQASSGARPQQSRLCSVRAGLPLSPPLRSAV